MWIEARKDFFINLNSVEIMELANCCIFFKMNSGAEFFGKDFDSKNECSEYLRYLIRRMNDE